jgi:2-phosphosulfolactate phosphatase
VLVHVAFTPGERTPAAVGIVVDVLRATSTMTQALAAGYDRILCCAEIDEARELAEREGPAVLAGERRLEHIEGFQFGNSPREVAGQPVAPTLVLSTTNGTRLLVDAASRFEHVYVGSLLNLSAVAAAARRHGNDVAVLCAGVLGELALDDAYCAGRIAAEVGGDATDSATAAIRLAGSYESAGEALSGSRSGWNLRRNDLAADIDWCAREDALSVVPRFVRMVGAAAEVRAENEGRLPREEDAP